MKITLTKEYNTNAHRSDIKYMVELIAGREVEVSYNATDTVPTVITRPDDYYEYVTKNEILKNVFDYLDVIVEGSHQNFNKKWAKYLIQDYIYGKCNMLLFRPYDIIPTSKAREIEKERANKRKTDTALTTETITYEIADTPNGFGIKSETIHLSPKLHNLLNLSKVAYTKQEFIGILDNSISKLLDNYSKDAMIDVMSMHMYVSKLSLIDIIDVVKSDDETISVIVGMGPALPYHGLLLTDKIRKRLSLSPNSKYVFKYTSIADYAIVKFGIDITRGKRIDSDKHNKCLDRIPKIDMLSSISINAERRKRFEHSCLTKVSNKKLMQVLKNMHDKNNTTGQEDINPIPLSRAIPTTKGPEHVNIVRQFISAHSLRCLEKNTNTFNAKTEDDIEIAQIFLSKTAYNKLSQYSHNGIKPGIMKSTFLGILEQAIHNTKQEESIRYDLIGMHMYISNLNTTNLHPLVYDTNTITILKDENDRIYDTGKYTLTYYIFNMSDIVEHEKKNFSRITVTNGNLLASMLEYLPDQVAVETYLTNGIEPSIELLAKAYHRNLHELFHTVLSGLNDINILIKIKEKFPGIHESLLADFNRCVNDNFNMAFRTPMYKIIAKEEENNKQ